MDRRLIAVLAVLAVALAAVPMMESNADNTSTTGGNSSATETETVTYYTGYCGTTSACAKWKFTLSGNVLEITNTGTIDAFSTWSLEEAYDSSGKISNATLPTFKSTVKDFNLKILNSSITSVGTAFKGVTEIKTIMDLNGVTSIADDAFSGCTSLIQVKSAGNVTTIGKNAFKGCSDLTTVSFSKATKIGESAFDSCKELTKVECSKVTEIGASAFNSCEALTAFTLPAEVTAIANSTFKGCKALASFETTAKLKTLDESAFEGCEKLKNVDMTKSTAFESIGASAFKGCKVLDTLTIADSTKTIGASAFDGCVALKSVTLKDVTSIGATAFNGCIALEEAKLGKVTTLDNSAFKGCSKLAKLEVDATNTAFSSKDNVIYGLDRGSETSIYMAANILKDTVKDIPTTVKRIHLDYSDRIYLLDGGKYPVTTVSLSGATSTVIVYYTQGVKELKSISADKGIFGMKYTLYSGWDPNSFTFDGKKVEPKMDGGYYTVSEKFTAGKGYEVLPVGVKNLTLKDLQDITRTDDGWTVKTDPEVKEENGVITDILGFTCIITGYEGSRGDAILKTSYILKNLECKVTDVKPEKGWGNLSDLTIRGDVPVSQGAFMDTSGLRGLKTVDMTSIPENMFRYCMSLQSATLDGCKSVGAYAFEGCITLRSVDLGTTGFVDPTAFSMCPEVSALKVDVGSAFSDDGLFVVRCDADGVYFRQVGNLLEIRNAEGYSSFSVVTPTTGAEPVVCKIYKGGIGVLDITGMDSIILEGTRGSNDPKCLVVFDTRGGSAVASQEVMYNGKPVAVADPVRDGYTFLGWFSYPVMDPSDDAGAIKVEDQVVSETTVYYAHWAGEESSQNLHIYVIIGVVVAVVASVAMLVYHRLR